MQLEVQMLLQVSVPHPTEGRRALQARFVGVLCKRAVRRRAIHCASYIDLQAGFPNPAYPHSARFVVAQFIVPLILTCRRGFLTSLAQRCSRNVKIYYKLKWY